jgi:hypothetical protein
MYKKRIKRSAYLFSPFSAEQDVLTAFFFSFFSGSFSSFSSFPCFSHAMLTLLSPQVQFEAR